MDWLDVIPKIGRRGGGSFGNIPGLYGRYVSDWGESLLSFLSNQTLEKMNMITSEHEVRKSASEIGSSEIVCFKNPRFSAESLTDDIFSLIYALTRAARSGQVRTVVVVDNLFDDYTKLPTDTFRLVVYMLSSFQSVSLCRASFSTYQLGCILASLSSSMFTTNIHVEQMYIATPFRDDIKTSSGTVGISNGNNFLQKISELLSDRIPTDIWNFGWVFIEAQRMVVYVAQNTFYTPVSAEVGVRIFVYACAFVLGMHEQDFDDDIVLKLATERCLSVSDPCTSLIIGATQTGAGFMPGPTQSAFGFSSIPGEYPLFHSFLLRPEVQRKIDTREDVRGWTEVSALPFLFARMCAFKRVTFLDVDELFAWSLTVF
jgi:hypothetical protein